TLIAFTTPPGNLVKASRHSRKQEDVTGSAGGIREPARGGLPRRGHLVPRWETSKNQCSRGEKMNRQSSKHKLYHPRGSPHTAVDNFVAVVRTHAQRRSTNIYSLTTTPYVASN